MLKLDLHIHSQYSDDAAGTPKEIIEILKKRGIDGVAFTDHNTVKGGLKAIKIAPKDFIVIPGVEISSKDGHIIGLNLKDNIPRGLTCEETIEKIIELGGTPIIPHLFRNMSGVKKAKLEKNIKKINAIEVFNSCSLPQTNLKTQKIAKQLKLGGVGGSDAHNLEYLGYGYTTVDINNHDIESVLSEINKKKTWGEGMTLPLDYRRDRMIKSIKQFFQRGLKRI